MASLRFLLSHCASLGLEIHRMDVKAAFLHGVPEEEVFMKYPEGYTYKKESGTCLKLVESPYGLKQSPRCWYRKLTEVFETLKFKASSTDPCLFIDWEGVQPLMVFLHVDDMIIGGDIRKLKTISLSQELYINKILTEFGMMDCKSVTTPMIPGTRLVPSKEEDLSIDFEYRKAVGLLNYLTLCTRPYLAYVTFAFSQFLEKPSKDHVAAFKRVLRYLQGTKSDKLTLGGDGSPIEFKGYSDSDWGSNVDGKSFSGYRMVYGGFISWKTMKQPTVAL
ncbi:hypothetical protein O181_015832 [Austropuccinia psidii MF-1]|uniref:Reverse transcriptase Ty1/copia-type domain-containing protein n=1 Tax=Austropuccinia psidii MF-1 TaxID=1389203 RepID=A0A9Q3C4F8_9BASI|nr:hypothetical protein [Austropuccinia psidii MF-1]